jgi:hypothetical protein
MFADEDLHRHAAENLDQADAPLWPSELRNDGGNVSAAGAGGKPLANGGPPEARLGAQEARSIAWTVAHVGTKRVGKRGTWCAEVGPMLPGDCPRALRFGEHTAVREER